MAILKIQVRQELSQFEQSKTIAMLRTTLRGLDTKRFVDIDNGHVDGDSVVFHLSDATTVMDVCYIIGALQSTAPSIIRDIQVIPE